MPRPLQRKRKDGSLYTRFPEIERAIDEALQQDEQTIIARAPIERGKAGYLPSECLVHLMREAKRLGDRRKMSVLFNILSRRCVANLRQTVSKRLPAAEQLREDILGDLLELIVADTPKLDFFEVRFDRAFEKLRIDRVRQQRRRANVERSTEDIDVASAVDVAESLVTKQQIELVAEHLDLLTAKERTAFGLRFIDELSIESIDPNEPTIAGLMGVSGRSVGSYLKSALEKLRNAVEREK